MEKKFIEDKQGNKVLPITHVSAVLDDSGNDIGSVMGAFEDEVRGMITTPNQGYVTVEANSSTTTANIATVINTQAGDDKQKSDTIYRVSNWDGSQYIVTSYSEYAYNGSNYVFLCQKSQIGEVFDISAYNSNTKYADLSAALGTNGANVPQELRKGGMSVKYVSSSDNKYIRYNLLADSFTTDTTQWAIDDEGVYVDNPEFIYVKTDKDDKILWAIRTDGSIYYGAGVPPQIIDYINEKISELSLDEYEDIVAFLSDFLGSDETLKEYLDEIYGKYTDNPEFIEIETDSTGKIIRGTRKDGSTYIAKIENDEVNHIGGVSRYIDYSEIDLAECDTITECTIATDTLWRTGATYYSGYKWKVITVPDGAKYMKIRSKYNNTVAFLYSYPTPTNNDSPDYANISREVFTLNNDDISLPIGTKYVIIQIGVGTTYDELPYYVGFASKMASLSAGLDSVLQNYQKGKQVEVVTCPEAAEVIISTDDAGATAQSDALLNMASVVKLSDDMYYMYYLCIGKNESLTADSCHLAFAYSTDGFNWNRSFPAGVEPPVADTNFIFNSGINNCQVFKVTDNEYPFRLLGCTYTSSREVVLYKSADGIHFEKVRTIFHFYFDNQPSCIVRGNLVKVYLRWRSNVYGNSTTEGNYRWIGTFTMDIDGNVICPPTILFGLNHYQASASPLDERRELLFPTYFDPELDEQSIRCYTVDGIDINRIDLNTDNLIGNDEQSYYVSPGLVNIGDDMYLFMTSRTSKHNQYSQQNTVCRIKMAKVHFVTTGRDF